MTWQANQSQQQSGNGQQFQRRIPDLGKGRFRLVDKSKLRGDPSKAPDFRGLINVDGHIIEVSLWHSPAKQGQNGMMPESFSAHGRTADPVTGIAYTPQGQTPAQQTAQNAPVYAQQAPGPAYAPSAQPPQNGGYAPAPGYQPPQQPAQPPRWGGGPQAQAAPQQTAAAGYVKSDIPF